MFRARYRVLDYIKLWEDIEIETDEDEVRAYYRGTENYNIPREIPEDYDFYEDPEELISEFIHWKRDRVALTEPMHEVERDWVDTEIERLEWSDDGE